MSSARQLRLGAFMRPTTIHTGGWRYPGASADANFNLAHLVRAAQTLERGKFDAFFMADHLAVLNMPIGGAEAQPHRHLVRSLTLLPALAMVTERLGLVATASTTFEQPYLIARRFASLDHISGGRAGWNIVTTSNPDAALNFGLEEHMEHGERYRRAREFYEVVTGLWDSWADDAFVRDVESGIYFDPAKLHVLDHKGPHLSVRGPLNIARPVQGWPVIVQAGASDAGRQLAAETAEVVFAARSRLADGQAFYADVKGAHGGARARPRRPQDPAGRVRGGRRDATPRRARSAPSSTASSITTARIASLSIALGHDASRFDPDAPLPDIPETNASKSGRERVDRAGQARQPDGSPARPAPRRLFRPRLRRHAEDHRRRDGAMARRATAATAST